MVTKENDRYEWMRETAEHLRNKEFDEIDPVATADWFDEVSGSDRREVRSRLAVLIEHRLKLDYVKGLELARNRRGWLKTARLQRRELPGMFEESPSLRNLLTHELLQKTYASVRLDVAEVYEVDPPAECPYGYEELLEEGK
jgi:hypothetical protein